MSYQPEPKFLEGDYIYYKDFLYQIDKISWQDFYQQWYYLIHGVDVRSAELVEIAKGNEYFRKA